MRWMLGVVAAGLAVAGCDTGGTAGAGNTAGGSMSARTTPATATPAATAAAGFSPPTTISRADYGGRTERRFRKLDKDGDGKLARTELPGGRADRLLRRMDKNGDASLDAAEWSQGMLARFDKQDVNHDGNLTSDERGKAGGGRRQRRIEQPGGIADEGDEVDNGL